VSPESSETEGDATTREQRRQLEETLRLAAEGDQHCWRILIETYSGRVFGLIRAQCGSSDLAEEITQSTFCTVVAKIGSYTELGKFEQWLFRIAMNRLRDEMRRRKRQARPVEDEALTALAEGVAAGRSGATGGAAGGGGAAPEPSVLAPVGGPELRALRIAMTQLSESDQHIIHLRHNAGLSFKQIAEVLEQPLGTVLARQHRALKKLGELLRGSLGRDHPLLRPAGPESANDHPVD
jgi:RNA polymerase sigma-70 factor, ECF subfamily